MGRYNTLSGRVSTGTKYAACSLTSTVPSGRGEAGGTAFDLTCPFFASTLFFANSLTRDSIRRFDSSKRPFMSSFVNTSLSRHKTFAVLVLFDRHSCNLLAASGDKMK